MTATTHAGLWLPLDERRGAGQHCLSLDAKVLERGIWDLLKDFEKGVPDTGLKLRGIAIETNALFWA